MKNVFGLTINYKLEPKRNNLFTLRLDSVPNVGEGKPIDALQIDLISGKRPQYSHNVMEIKRLNMKYKIAQAPTMGDTMPVTFRDNIQTNLGRVFYMWNKVMFNRQNGTMGYASAYKTDGYLDIFDPRGTVTERWRIKGLFPSETNWGELTYDSEGEPLTVAVTFAYDIAWLDETVDPATTSTEYWTKNLELDSFGAQGHDEPIEIPQNPKKDVAIPIPSKVTTS